MLLYFDLVLDLGQSCGRNLLEKLDETPQNSAQNSSKRRLFAVVRGFLSLSGEVAVPLVVAGGRGGVVLDGRLVGFESGWSRSEEVRDMKRYIFLKSEIQNEKLLALEATAGGMVGRRRPSAARWRRGVVGEGPGVFSFDGRGEEMGGMGREREMKTLKI